MGGTTIWLLQHVPYTCPFSDADPAGGVDLTIVATHLEVVLSADPGDPHSERVVIKVGFLSIECILLHFYLLQFN